MTEHIEYAELYRELNAPVTSYRAVCKLASRGLPDACGIRPLTWMLLLHTAPLDRSKRQERRSEHCSSYWRFVEMFTTNPIKDDKAGILQRIQNDVKRTMRINHLFVSDPSHSAALIRILFVFANLWPQIGYVQGLNEIAGPMYYVFRNDQCKGHQDSDQLIEADTFFCFMNLVARLNFYIEDMDSAQGGIMSIMHEMNERLGQIDIVLHRHLSILGIEPAFYSLRWITTIFTREFSLPDSYRLWDTLFTIPQTEIVDFIQAFCCAMLIAIREDLLRLHHDAALQMLQDYPSTVRMENLLALCQDIRSGLVTEKFLFNVRASTILSKIWKPSHSESSRDLFSSSATKSDSGQKKDRNRKHLFGLLTVPASSRLSKTIQK